MRRYCKTGNEIARCPMQSHSTRFVTLNLWEGEQDLWASNFHVTSFCKKLFASRPQSTAKLLVPERLYSAGYFFHDKPSVPTVTLHGSCGLRSTGLDLWALLAALCMATACRVLGESSLR